MISIVRNITLKRFGIVMVISVISIIPFITSADGEDDHDDTVQASVNIETTSTENQINRGYIEASTVAEGITINLNVRPKNILTGESSTLELFVNKKPSGVPVTDLQLNTEESMHVIGVRNDLSQFFHIYPKQIENSTGIWNAEYTFRNPGVYKIWSNIKQGGTAYSFGHKLISVSGEGDLGQGNVEFLENVIVGDYQVALDLHEAVNAGSNAEISFLLSDVFGRGVELDSYLGEDMHITIIKDDLDVFIHAHPSISNIEEEGDGQSFRIINQALAHGEENNLTIVKLISNIVFPEEGIYKIFVEFRPVDAELPPDEALVAEFYVRVGESLLIEDGIGDGHTDHTHAPVSNVPWYQNITWWVLFLSSLVLMALLSFGVNKYLQTDK